MHSRLVIYLLALSAFLSPVFAHFKLVWPPARGFDEDELVNYPCGGQNKVSSKRTQYPINGAPIQLDMGHVEAQVQVLIGYGNNPTGDSFTQILVPTFQEVGPNNFCMGDVPVPEGKAGINATILVTTNGDTGGGLYNCADVTLSTSSLSASERSMHCKNSTGVKASPIANGASINPNGTNVATDSSSSPSSSPSSSSSTGAAVPHATMGSWALGAAGVLGGLAML